MNGIQAFTSVPWIIRLGWTLLHFLWQGTAIAIVYAAVRFLFTRSFSASTRYTLACVALLAMAIAPLLTFFTIAGGVSAVPDGNGFPPSPSLSGSTEYSGSPYAFSAPFSSRVAFASRRIPRQRSGNRRYITSPQAWANLSPPLAAMYD
jgi:hypothetical protein